MIKKIMSILLVLMLITLSFSCTTSEEKASDEEHKASEEAHWSYSGKTGPESWADMGFPDLNGVEQSPIDVPMNAPVNEDSFIFNYAPSALNIVNNGHSIKVAYDEGSTVEVEGKTFQLLQLHFHALSEHTIAGEHSAMEMHLVHQSADGEYAVLGVLIDRGADNDFYNSIWENLPEHEGELETIKSVEINALDLLPSVLSYYRYNGSFTTPPGTEGVNWFLFNTVLEMSDDQISDFETIYSENFRPVQPFNDREFF